MVYFDIEAFFKIITIALLIELTETYTNQFTQIKHHFLQDTRVTSIFPQGWKKPAIEHKVLQQGDSLRIKEIVWFPFPLDNTRTHSDFFCFDDNHFISRLSEEGFVVHIVQCLGGKDFTFSLAETVDWLTAENGICKRDIAIASEGLFISNVLEYLSIQNTLSQPGTDKFGSIILLDPIPLSLLSSTPISQATSCLHPLAIFLVLHYLSPLVHCASVPFSKLLKNKRRSKQPTYSK
jgi:hypothetical protein